MCFKEATLKKQAKLYIQNQKSESCRQQRRTDLCVGRIDAARVHVTLHGQDDVTVNHQELPRMQGPAPASGPTSGDSSRG
jgi:hypothetical protein